MYCAEDENIDFNNRHTVHSHFGESVTIVLPPVRGSTVPSFVHIFPKSRDGRSCHIFHEVFRNSCVTYTQKF